MRKKPTRKRPYRTLFQDGICYDCDIACASGKMHHGILFDRRLRFDISLQNFKKPLDNFLKENRKKTFQRIFSYNSGCKRKF